MKPSTLIASVRLKLALGLGAAVLAGVVVIPGVVLAQTAPSVWVVDATDHVFASSTQPATPSTAISLYAAGNEYEAAQIAVRCTGAVTNVQVRAGDLQGPGGATIPASQIQVRREYNHPNVSLVAGAVAPPDGGTAYYDALIDDAPVSLPADSTLPYYYSVHVPTGQAPGVYSGVATVGSDGGDVVVPVSVRVYPVTIPPANKSTFLMNNWFTSAGWDYAGTEAAIPLQYANAPMYSDNWWRVIGNFAADQARHRDNVIYADFQALLIPNTVIDAAGNETFGWATFDHFIRTFIDAGALQEIYTPTLLELSPTGGAAQPMAEVLQRAPDGSTQRVLVTPGTTSATAYFKRLFAALKAHLDAEGWTGMFTLSALDEPSTSAQAAAANWLYGIYHSYFPQPSTNEAHISLFTGDESALSTLTPNTHLYDAQIAHYQSQRLAGKNLWLYTANGPTGGYMNRFISFPLADTRLLPWMIWKNHGAGYLHWGWNYWVDRNASTGQWEASDTFDGPQSGDTWLVRPNKAAYSVYDSTRSEAQLDGQEDVELLNILAATEPAAAASIADSLVNGLTSYDTSGADIALRHRQILDEITAGGPDGSFPFADNFGQGAASWTHPRGTWSVTSSGQYTQTDTSAWGLTAAIGARAYRDLTADVDLSITAVNASGGASNWAGLVVHSLDATDMDTGYVVALRNTGQVFVYRSGTTLGTAQVPGYQAGAVTHLRVRATGDTISVYAQTGTAPLLTVHDSGYPIGSVALVTGQASAVFDNVRVDPDLDHASARTVTTSSSYTADGWSPGGLVDGRRTSDPGALGWTSAGSSTAAQTQWAQVDLGAPYPLSRIDLYPRSDGSNAGLGFPVDFSIQVSTDGVGWTTVAARTGYPRPTATAQSFPFATRTARYLRVTGTRLSADASGTYYLQLAEIEALGGDLAAGRPVSTSSSYSSPGGGWLASYATDGVHLATPYSIGWSSAADAGSAATEWLSVDLGGPSVVNRVVLYPRSDGSKGGAGFPVDFAIQTSMDGVSWTTAVTRTGYPAPDASPQSFTVPQTTARYVRVLGTKLGQDPLGSYRMQLGEIEVR